MQPRLGPSILALLLVLSGVARAAPFGAAAWSARIDQRLEEAWKRAGVRPASGADDATFLRRASLDLIGRIPTVAELREFLEDPAGDKRERAVDRLLDAGASARHNATLWRRVWLPQADTPRFAGLADPFEEWLAGGLRDGKRYDQLARELLTVAPEGRGLNPAGRASPRAFLTANESAPENLAAAATRAFLGINLECAQCHNHPFARWTRDQFWQTAAFFARPSRKGDAQPVRLALALPDSGREVTPRLLDDADVEWPATLDETTGRQVFARWAVAADNRYFARNAVNRVWAQFFGTGLVEPLDDLSDENPPSHPELLDELARAFAEGGFDLRALSRAIALSRAYGQSALAPAEGSVDPDSRLFARMTIRGLTGEQLYDSLRVAAGLSVERNDLDPEGATRARRRFAEEFRIERTATAKRSVTQALALINGPLSAELTNPAASPLLAATADAPFLDARGQIETLYLAALGRRPDDNEARPLVSYVETRGADVRTALADVFWALLNSSEFNTNHCLAPPRQGEFPR
ncbi:MAG: DUF1553 domain-containing protein [Isosphaeraceae bacterium]|nr:DUF1553 domain-containing protein [Isosphaeraceae bacterium]